MSSPVTWKKTHQSHQPHSVTTAPQNTCELSGLSSPVIPSLLKRVSGKAGGVPPSYCHPPPPHHIRDRSSLPGAMLRSALLCSYLAVSGSGSWLLHQPQGSQRLELWSHWGTQAQAAIWKQKAPFPTHHNPRALSMDHPQIQTQETLDHRQAQVPPRKPRLLPYCPGGHRPVGRCHRDTRAV